jgi:glycosyltransferase involved in cell wall biosynthesis
VNTPLFYQFKTGHFFLKEIDIFVLTYNRPRLVLRAIDSIFSQRSQNFNLTISDNSPNDETEKAIKKYDPSRFTYVHRKPSLAPLEHFNAVLDEVKSKYFMMFHDDDEMHADLTNVLYRELEENTSIVAVGVNARICKGSLLHRLNNSSPKNDILIASPDEIAERYLRRKWNAAFPSYLYRSIVASHVRPSFLHGGKYADVSFLMDITRFGKILMKAEPLMDYYVHKGQDSQTNEFIQRISLINYITTTTKYDRKHRFTRKYRVANLYDNLRTKFSKNERIKYSQRRCKVYSIILRYSPFNLFPKLVCRTILSILKQTVSPIK